MFRVGRYYMTSYLNEEYSVVFALDYLVKATMKNHIKAKQELEIILEIAKSCKNEKNLERFSFFKKYRLFIKKFFLQKGNSDLITGFLHYHGVILEKDYLKSYSYYKKAIAEGNRQSFELKPF